MNKRGEVEDEGTMDASFPLRGALTIMLLIIVFFIFLWTISLNGYAELRIPEGVREKDFSDRFLRSPDCFSHVDGQTGRVYPLEFDWEKVDEARLRDCYPATNIRLPSYRLVVESDSGALKKELTTANWDEGNAGKKTSHRIMIRQEGTILGGTMHVFAKGT
ncbi:MAG: hypothetical protein ABIC95_01170 [archaeon]